MIDQDERPAPDALLAEASREGRGRMKVFLGAYPGVGKTYGMLQAAHERRREGVDVVVGLVETHGREETESLVRGFEVLPRKKLLHRGQVFGEMDLEAILWRKPALVLVDELAHTNIPGSRHPKRWQDVEELLGAGIDVYTTLNIQHIESLNDVVARIVGIPVRETVPDRVLEIADSIELVDLPPEELIGRLREGKVYVPEQVGRAIRNFFSKGNLAALRELAFRVAAQRVDAEVEGYMRAHAVQGPWPVSDRLLVCINESPLSKKLVRSARRMAERRQIPWIALHVRTTASESLDDAVRGRIPEALQLAESLGAETVTLTAESDVVREILNYARSRNVTQLIVGRPRRRRFSGLFREHVARDLAERATEFEVTLVAPGDGPSARDAIRTRLPRDTWHWRSYAWATGITALATAAGYGVFLALPLPNISLVFVVAVMVTAVRFGLGASIWASILSFLAYNFFFTVPYHTLSVFREHELFTIVFFLVVAVLVANLAGRLHRQVAAMRTAGRRTANLFEFSRRVAGAATLDDVLWAAVHHVASTMQGRSLVLLPDSAGRLSIAAGYPPEDQLSATDWAASHWCWENGRPAGRASDTLPFAEWHFLPLASQQGRIGVLGVGFGEGETGPDPERRRLLEALSDQVAVAVERAQLAGDIEEARILGETEKLRSALLSSISHDLRTPLVSIIGSATTLADRSALLDEPDRRELLDTILHEARRLNRFVQNLLDMTRLGHGALELKREWSDLHEIAGRAARDVAPALGARHLSMDVPPEVPALFVDPLLIEQVLVNLLDNAAKFTAKDGRIAVVARRRGDSLVLRIADDGPGIAAEDRERVFDMFFRARQKDSRTAGTGLGLAICRGIVEAHGGTIRVIDSESGRGATVEFTLPLREMPSVESEDDEAGRAAP